MERTPARMVVVAGAERNTIPDAMISAYKIVHAIGNTQLGGVRGDWLRDLYHAEEATVFIYILNTL